MSDGKGMTFLVHWENGTVPLPLRRGQSKLSLETFMEGLLDSQALIEDARTAPAILYFEYEDDEGERIAVRCEEEFLVMLSQVLTVAHVFPITQVKVPERNTRTLPLPTLPTLDIPGSLARDELAFDSDSSFQQALNRGRLRQENIEKITILGSGHCGTVYKALDKENQRLLAVKHVSLDVCSEVQAQILMELEILNKCSSPFVVEFHGALLGENSISMCMEFMDAGSMAECPQVSEIPLTGITTAVVQGLDYIWSLKVMHRDVKPSNILLNSTGAVKLCDFGVSTQLEESIAKSYVGTGLYMAPERILGGEYRVHSDVWSLGVTLLEGALGRFPFGQIVEGETPVTDVMQKLFRKKSDKMKNLLICGTESHKLSIDPSDVETAQIAVDSLTPSLFIATSSAVHILSSDNQETSVPLKDVLGSSGDKVEVLQYLSDQLLLFIGMKGGDVGTLDPGLQAIECVGSLEGGIAGGSWSPDLEIAALVSGNGVLYLMNRDMDVVGEIDEDPSTSGQEVQESVGWGKKETQFHGSAGKQAALSQTQEEDGLLEWDSRTALVSWHGEGQYFAVSSVSKNQVRKIRVWSREGVHLNTMEATAGMEPTLSWRPAGNLIASSAQREEGLEVVFFERNGLKHGGFPLRVQKSTQSIKSLDWNGNSTILAVHRYCLTKPKESVVELWTVSNYHWSLKYSFKPEGGVIRMLWDPEDLNQIHFLLSDGSHRSLRLQPASQPSPPSTSAILPVIDGKEIRVTDFERGVIPPPMSLFSASHASAVNEVFFHPDGTAIFAFLDSGAVQKCEISTRNQTECIKPRNSCPNEFLWSWAFNGKDAFAALLSTQSGYSLVIFDVDGNSSVSSPLHSTPLEKRPILLLPNADHAVLVQFEDGSWASFTWTGQVLESKLKTKFRMSCSKSALAWVGAERGPLIGLSERNQLFVDSVEVGNNISSFALHSHFLLLTTLAHQLILVPFENLRRSEVSLSQLESRSLERGSELVCAVPGKSRVVLQMPRGNVETIHPRALSLHYLYELLEKSEYKEAMQLMKKQRINLNLLVDHCRNRFLSNFANIITSVQDIPAMNMLLLELKNEDVRQTMYRGLYPDCSKAGCSCGQREIGGKVKEVVAKTLETTVESREWLTLALTAFHRSDPPLIEDALHLLKKHMATSQNPTAVADEGLRHLLYLIDGEELFRMALATHDFDLILLVAERSQKDPREYIPFLNELRKLDENYMKFKIDTTLERFSRALGHLKNCGDERFEEFLEFVQKHGLYLESLELYPRPSDQHSSICCIYAEHLAKNGRHSEAVLFFRWAGKLGDALESAIRACLWQEALTIVGQLSESPAQSESLTRRVVDGLRDRREHASAALILEHQLKDERGACESYCSGESWHDAVRICGGDPSSEIGKEVVLPSMKKKMDELTSSLRTVSADLEKHSTRLAFLRENKKLKWDALIAGDPDFPDADMYSETTMSTASDSTGRSSISRGGTSRRGPRRIDRKKRTLKEGSRYEDFGILNAIKDAMNKTNSDFKSIRDLIWAAIRMDLLTEASELREIYFRVLKSCESKLERVWPVQWLPHMFPGPPDETFRDQNHNDPESTSAVPVLSYETAIKLDPVLQRPQIPKSTEFKLEFIAVLK